jgi:hypothetical protein
MKHILRRRAGFCRRLGTLLAGALLASTLQTQASPLQTVDLSGTWNFTPSGGSATTIQVPGGGWYKQGFTSISEADYQRTITVPDSGQPQVTRLEFGAVNYQADLYIDGTLVGSRIQSFTPASFDISDYVVPGNSYSLRVHVKGRSAFMSGGKSLVPNAAGWSANTPQGIFRSAKLQVYPQVSISDVFVKPSVENTSLSYDVWLTNASSSTAQVNLTGSLSSWNGDAWSYPALPAQAVSLAPNSTTKVTVGPVNWDLGPDSYWWPNVPYQSGYTARLHNLNLTLAPAAGGPALDTTSVRFGFRECVQKSDGTNTCYFLNGIRVNFRGDNIQGADYDSILSGGGRGDAFDTLPGFLAGANGWPKAVDNYQRLNYNVVRLHQEPVTPSMLDVCDEMGLMLIEETAIRGSANDQDFINGHDNMVNHLKALFTRDRNHASIVRQSLDNEPNQSSTDSTQFQVDLYNAAMSVDGTRPLSVDVGAPANTYESMTSANFSVYRHYGTGTQFGQYTDEVFARSDRPYGQGEFIWYSDNTSQGFTWFATAAQAMRAKGASDIRPYTLLSAWTSFIPGVSRSDMTLELKFGTSVGPPLYGEDNLPDPWSNSQIQRVQAGFNPVLVADSAYWSANKLSNAAGDWPATIPTIAPGQAMNRTLTIYNDTFGGMAVDVTWEFRRGSVTGPIYASGVIHATVPLGYTRSEAIAFTAPNAPDGTAFYLVLATRKDGVEMFRENSEQFRMLNQTQLSGTAFGTAPYAAGSEYGKATDGDPATFFDAAVAVGGYTGIDLGANGAKRISSIVFTPRAGFESRMVGGTFQGSNDGSNYTTLYTVTAASSVGATVSVNTYQSYRYLRYVGSSNSYCNIAEMAFYSINGTPLTGTAFGASPAYSAGHEYDKAVDGSTGTYYDYSQSDGGYAGIDLGAGNASKVGFIVFTPRTGFEGRMAGGTFSGSNDGVNYTTLHTVTAAPAASTNTLAFVNTTTAYRYLKYSAPAGSYGNIAEMAFSASATPVAPPAAPTGLSATAGNGQVSLSWGGAVGAGGYSVKRALASGGSYATRASNVSGTSYTDTGLTNGTTYYYVVSTTNEDGESADSPEVSATPVAPPAAPVGVAATAGDGQVALGWSGVSGAQSYTVKRSTTSGSGYASLMTGVTGTSDLDTSVTNGTTYYYVISAVNAGGESANSAEVSAKPSAPFNGEEIAPPFLVLSGNDGVFTIKSSVSGHVYQLQSTDDLVNPSWQDIGPVKSGTGGALQFVVPVDLSTHRRFYRILIGR